MKYTIVIEETLSKEFEVEANSYNEALEISQNKYRECEFVLDPGNVISKQMAVIHPENEVTEWIEF